jgi:hypothetical protein
MFKKRKLYLPMNLQMFAGEPGDGNNDDPGDGDGASGGGDNEPFAVFNTKEDLNKRLSRAEKKGQKALLQELGFDSLEDLQAALGKGKDPDDKQTKQENNDQNGEKVPDVKTLVDEMLKAEREKTWKRLVTAEVKMVATELGFADWEDAYALANLSEVKEDEKGNIIGVKEALQALADKKPHLIKQKNTSGGFGADVPNRQQANRQQSLEDIKKLAQNRGVTANAPYDPWAR